MKQLKLNRLEETHVQDIMKEAKSANLVLSEQETQNLIKFIKLSTDLNKFIGKEFKFIYNDKFNFIYTLINNKEMVANQIDEKISTWNIEEYLEKFDKITVQVDIFNYAYVIIEFYKKNEKTFFKVLNIENWSFNNIYDLYKLDKTDKNLLLKDYKAFVDYLLDSNLYLYNSLSNFLDENEYQTEFENAEEILYNLSLLDIEEVNNIINKINVNVGADFFENGELTLDDNYSILDCLNIDILYDSKLDYNTLQKLIEKIKENNNKVIDSIYKDIEKLYK